MGLTASAITGLALAAAGTATSMAAASSARSDMNRQVVESVKRQEAFQREASPVFQESLEASGPRAASKRIAEGIVGAKERYAKTQTPTITGALPVDSARAEGAVEQFQNASATGEGYADQGVGQWLANENAKRKLGVISNLATTSAGNAGILGQLAGNRSADLAGIGSLMSTAGNLAAIYGGINQQAAPKRTPLQKEMGPQ